MTIKMLSKYTLRKKTITFYFSFYLKYCIQIAILQFLEPRSIDF